MRKAALIVRYGPMGAEKTSWLIDQYLPGKTMAFVPALDHRSGSALKSHNGKRLDGVVVIVRHDQPGSILKELDGVKRILIDEINFFNQDLVKVIERVREKGIQVMASGLLLDSDLKDFGPTRQLARGATQAQALFARCDFENGIKCQKPAVFNYFKGKKPGQVVVGAFDLYGVSCPEHFGYFREKYRCPKLTKEINLEEVWQV